MKKLIFISCVLTIILSNTILSMNTSFMLNMSQKQPLENFKLIVHDLPIPLLTQLRDCGFQRTTYPYEIEAIRTTFAHLKTTNPHYFLEYCLTTGYLTEQSDSCIKNFNELLDLLKKLHTIQQTNESCSYKEQFEKDLKLPLCEKNFSVYDLTFPVEESEECNTLQLFITSENVKEDLVSNSVTNENSYILLKYKIRGSFCCYSGKIMCTFKEILQTYKKLSEMSNQCLTMDQIKKSLPDRRYLEKEETNNTIIENLSRRSLRVMKIINK